jgi:hypothetical protein
MDNQPQRIINAHYNQLLLTLLELTTKYEVNTCTYGAPERLPAFGARTFPTVITSTSVVQDLNEKIAGVDFMMR